MLMGKDSFRVLENYSFDRFATETNNTFLCFMPLRNDLPKDKHCTYKYNKNLKIYFDIYLR
jgi:hypothetical protein